MTSCEIVVEPGACHDGSLDRMRWLMDFASLAGATAFKPQFWSNSDRLADRRNMTPSDPYLAIYRRYQMPVEWWSVLKAEAVRQRLALFGTVYLPEDVPVVAPWVEALKISSFESGDRGLVEACQKTGKPLILSTGMTDDDPPYITPHLLHCVSAYPAPLDALNLSVLHATEDPWEGGYIKSIYLGFSDHSADVRVGAWAVAAGAKMLEVHLRLDDTDPANPDVASALSPADLQVYIKNVRDCERAMGDGLKRVQAAEAPMLRYRVRS